MKRASGGSGGGSRNSKKSASGDGAHEDEASAFGEDLGEVFGRVPRCRR